MPAFSEIVAGTRQLSKPETVEIGPGDSITFCMRPLAPFESIAVLSAARSEAKAAGIDEPEAGDPLYEASREIHTLAYALVQPESTPDKAIPFFTGGAAEIQSSPRLTMDVIAYLFALWEHWYETISLQKGELDEIGFGRVMQGASVGDARPFLKLRRGTQWNCFRTMAARHLNLLRSKSDSFSGSQSPVVAAAEEPTTAAEAEVKTSLAE